MPNPYNKNHLDALKSQIYFRNKTLHVSVSSLSMIRRFSLYTRQWYTKQLFADSLRA